MKGSRMKIINKKHKDWNWKKKIGQTCTLTERERKEGCSLLLSCEMLRS
jgi:hypothetical protein